MLSKNLYLTVDLANGEIATANKIIFLSSLDKAATLHILLQNYKFEAGDSFVLAFRAADGSTFTKEPQFFKEESLLVYKIDGNITRHAGLLKIELIQTNNDNVIATMDYSVNIIKSILDELNKPDQEISILDFERWKEKIEKKYGDLNDIINNAKDEINQMIDQMLADPSKLAFVQQLKQQIDDLSKLLSKKQDIMQYAEDVSQIDGFDDVPQFLGTKGYYRVDTLGNSEVKRFFTPQNSTAVFEKVKKQKQLKDGNGNFVNNAFSTDETWELISQNTLNF